MSKATFQNVFGQYIQNGPVLARCASSRVEHMTVDQANGCLKVILAFPEFVEMDTLSQAESAISQVLPLAVSLQPKYPSESLCDACFPTLIALLRRENTAVNGTFDGAQCHLEESRMRITLTHGGLNILRATNTDAALTALVRETFGRSVELVFDGITEVDTESQEYRRMMEDADREAAFLAREAAMNAAASQPKETKRAPGEPPKPKKPADPAVKPAGGLPIYLETAQPVFGAPVRERTAVPTPFGDGCSAGMSAPSGTAPSCGIP